MKNKQYHTFKIPISKIKYQKRRKRQNSKRLALLSMILLPYYQRIGTACKSSNLEGRQEKSFIVVRNHLAMMSTGGKEVQLH